MDITSIVQQLESEIPGLCVKRSEPMSAHTTFRIGGPADLLCRPASIGDTIRTLKVMSENGLSCMIIGNGSNLLVRDGGVRGAVLETSALDRIERIGEDMIEAESGVSLTNLALFALDHALTGLEFAYGIPGTLGGAIFMNAGAYGGEMKQCVIETDYADCEGNIHTLTGAEHQFDYRHSFFTDHGCRIILRARLRLCPGDPERIADRMRELKRRRQESQPLQYPSAGSFFKRPAGYFAGKLISDSGLKGTRRGDAEVSEKHAGFIINRGGATCADVLHLMDAVQKTVREQYGVGLEPEVRIIGEEPGKER